MTPTLDRTLSFLVGQQDGGFTLTQQMPMQTNGGAAIADVNQDGLADIVVMSGGLTTLLGQADGGFVAWTQADGGSGTPFPQYSFSISGDRSIATADVNGDGFPDAVMDTGIGFVAVALGTGSGELLPPTFYLASPVFGVDGEGPIATADLNGDGIPDFVVCDTSPPPYSSGALVTLLGGCLP